MSPVVVTKSSVAAGGSSDATAVWDTTGNVSDHNVMRPTLVTPAWLASDQFGTHTVAVSNPLHAVDQLGALTLDGTWQDDAPIKFRSLFDASITGAVYGRGGTPDNDPGGDAWTDETLGQTGVNHGADATLTARIAPTGDAHAVAKINLTQFGDFVSVPGHATPLGVTIRASHDNALAAATLNVHFKEWAADPFTESTLTWDNEPDFRTGATLVTRSFPEGAATVGTIVCPEAKVNAALGKWLTIEFAATILVGVRTWTIDSREASAANRWSIELNLRRN